jgi:acyl-CoA thioesterase-1
MSFGGKATIVYWEPLTQDTEESPVILVDQYTGFNAATDTYDGIHPNARGEAKMAQKWFDAILELDTP